ncbi:SMI1/KNR4 family protein [Ottowia sp. GY511]|uniref:SMI1/KNR4 family protein n=1 Tax=Ottowia flava TaxID=2675430 RepID=A0ABW4KR42_9BURK|nr:SMI1/KNR4 family protein [Ottowia sp. GY511]TXK28360.1 SMI1/KNR4 family protein [Ottowia sp. GY511]
MIDCVADSALPPPSEAHVAEVQAYYEVKFPADYLRLLAQSNGCEPTRKYFDLDGNERVVERFLPMIEDAKADEHNGWADVEVVASQLDVRLATDPDAQNIDLIPIAALFAGDFVVLDYRANRAIPTVGVWNHEASTDFAPVVQTVAPTVTEFLGMLRAD